jgi:spermidine/putrescine transport system substrate-binding protein
MSDPFARPMRRRDVLRAGAGAAMGLTGLGALAGCRVDRQESSSLAATQRVVRARPDGDLVYFNWAEYLDPGLIEAFEKRYGVKVRESNFDSMPGMMAKLRAGNRYDLIFPGAEWADRLIKANQLLRIDHGQLTALGDQLAPEFTNPWYDEFSKHTVPYALYATGLIYRADKLSSMTGSWNDLKNPDARGRTFLLDDFQEGIGAGNLANRFKLNTADEGQVKTSKDWLLGVKRNLRGISSDDVGNMVSGNGWIHHGWNGDVVNIRNQVKNPEDYRFIKASEGIPLGTDTFAIPVNAPHPGTALTFINFVLQPENLARNVAYFGYPMPYAGARQPFADLVKDDPAINVTTDDLRNGQQYRDLGRDGLRLWDDAWTDVKAS